MNLNRSSRSSLVLGSKIATVIVATLAIFYRDLAIIANDALQTEFMSYILAIPFIFAYLIYRKRKILRAVIPLENQSQTKDARYLSTIFELLLVITAILLYWHGSYTSQPLEYHMLALPIFVAGLLLILFNPQTMRQLTFSIAFLIFLVPPPSEILYGLGANLSVVSSEVSNAIVNALGIPSSIISEYGNPAITITRLDGTTLPFTVDIAFSGIYSLIGFFVFVTFIAYIIRDKLWKKLSLVVLGIPLIYLINIIRITIILLIGYNYGKEKALQIFQLLGGWIVIFLGTLLLLLISEKIFKTQIFANPTEKCSQCNTKPQLNRKFCFACGRILKPVDITFHKRDIEKIIAIPLTIILLTSIQEPVFALAQSPPWSQIALLISKNSINLVAITGALLVAVVVLYALETMRQRKVNADVYQKLSKSDRQIIDGVRETKKQAMPTLDNIATTYQKTMAQSIDIDQLLQRLFELEKIGIIKSSVSNKHDEPMQTWKAEGKADEKPMKMRISLRRPEILTVLLLLIGITLVALSTFFFTRLDLVVHGDLYRYGLQFSYEWVEQYWTYSRLMRNSLAIAMLVTGVSIAFILVQVRTRRSYSKLLSCSLLIFGTFMIGFSVFFFNRLDYIVHGDLYRYGLQFSYEWAGPYWTYANLILGLLGLAVAMNTISITLILAAQRIHKIRVTATKLICSILFSVGVIALALSINYTSSTLAFIGLGLVFWGAILFYIRPEGYIKEILLHKTTLPSLRSLDQIMLELGYDSKGVYLPPKYLRDFDSSKVFISAQGYGKLPSPEQIQNEEDKVLIKNPEGILITPPGAELAKLFEETLGTSFTRINMQQIEQNMPRLLIEDLKIAQNVQIETKNNRVHVKIENSIYKYMCKEAKKSSNICSLLGCPLCSAIACVLAKATGKPVIIEKNQLSEDSQTTDTDYLLLEEPKEKT